MADRRRRRHQFHAAADVQHSAACNESFTDSTFQYFFILGDRRVLLLSDASPDREPARQGVRRDPRQRRARVADRPQRLSAAADRVRDGGLPGRRRGRAVRVLRPLRLGVATCSITCPARPWCGPSSAAPARCSDPIVGTTPVHHHPRGGVDALGAPFADRRRGGDPGRDLRAEGRGRPVERLGRAHRRAKQRREAATDPAQPSFGPTHERARPPHRRI